MNETPQWEDSTPVDTTTAEMPRWEDSVPIDEPHWDDSTPLGAPPSETPETDKALNQSREAQRSKVDWNHPVMQGVMDVVKSVPEMVKQLPGMAYQGAKFAVGGPQEKLQVGEELLKQAIPMGTQLAKDVQSPVGSREWTRGVLQMGMMATPALDLVRGIKAVPKIPLEKPPIQPEPPPIQRVSPETGETFYQYTEGGEPDASTIPSTTSVPEPEVRTQVGEETPLRQQGETTGAQEQPVPTSESVAAETPPTDAPVAEGGPSIRAVAERPIEAPPPGTIRGWEEATQHGENWLNRGGDINKVVTDFRKTGKVNELEMGKMNAYLQKLQSVTNQAGDALRTSPNDPKLQQAYQQAVEQEQSFTGAYKPMHTVASGSLAALQGHVPLDANAAASFTGLSRRFAEFKGKPMTPEEVVKADRISKQTQKSNGEYAKANGEVYKRLDTEYGRIRTTRTRPPTIEDLGKTFGEILDEVCDI